MHAEAPSADLEFSGHGVQTEDPAEAENEPAAQAAQAAMAVWPASPEYLPAMHRVQAADELADAAPE